MISSLNLRSLNVAVVDDDELYRFILKTQISQIHPNDKIQMFTNGREALEHLINGLNEGPKYLPDIIFLDLNMPVMDGWEFLESFSKIADVMPKEVTIYIVTSSMNPNDKKRAETFSYVSNFMVKPLTRDRIRETMKETFYEN